MKTGEGASAVGGCTGWQTGWISRRSTMCSTVASRESERIVCVVDQMDTDGQTACTNCGFRRSTGVMRRHRPSSRLPERRESTTSCRASAGAALTLYLDTAKLALLANGHGLDDAFCIGSSRQARVGYGRSVNVIDRAIAAVRPGETAVPLRSPTSSTVACPRQTAARRYDGFLPRLYQQARRQVPFAGIDVGGTDIKAVLVVDGAIVDYKEYDWFPANFTRSVQLIDPICLIARLCRRGWRSTGCPFRAARLSANHRAGDGQGRVR